MGQCTLTFGSLYEQSEDARRAVMDALNDMMAVRADNCDSPIVHSSLRRPEPYRPQDCHEYDEVVDGGTWHPWTRFE